MIHALQAEAANNSDLTSIQLREGPKNRAAETTDHLSGNKVILIRPFEQARYRCIISI
jgi:hypothetical protein